MNRKERWGWAAAVAIATIAAFFPALGADFVEWDDHLYVVENVHYREFSWATWRWMWTTLEFGNYHPLTWLTYALDYQLGGKDPFIYHLTNVLWHAATAVVFYFLILRLLPARDEKFNPAAAAFGALLFAVHPLRVESVAWVSERRDVLSGFFYIATILLYLKDRLALALAACVCSLLSKGIGVTLPGALIVLELYLKRRTLRQAAWRIAPYAALALPFTIIGVIAEHRWGALRPLSELGWDARLAQAFYSAAFYLQKSLVPSALHPFYEPPFPFEPWTGRFALSAAAVAALAALLFFKRRRWPAAAAAGAFYAAVLLPLCGIVAVSTQIAADRYTYLPCLGWAALAAGGLARAPRRAASLLALAWVAALGALTWRQCRIWRDSETLWRHTLAVEPRHAVARANLAVIEGNRGRIEEAQRLCSEAIALKPGLVRTYRTLATALAKQGKIIEALPFYKRSLDGEPDSQEAREQLAAGYYNAAVHSHENRRPLAAIRYYEQALAVKPDYAAASNNLGLALAQSGQWAKAIARYRAAAQADPGFAAPLSNWGDALAAANRHPEAERLYRKALELDASLLEARVNLGNALARQGKLEAAAAQYRMALKQDPDNGAARENLRRVLLPRR